MEFAIAVMDRDGVQPAVSIAAVEVGGRLADELGRDASPPSATDGQALGPRDLDEFAVVWRLVRESYAFAAQA